MAKLNKKALHIGIKRLCFCSNVSWHVLLCRCSNGNIEYWFLPYDGKVTSWLHLCDLEYWAPPAKCPDDPSSPMRNPGAIIGTQCLYSWASCQIRNIAGCACAGNAGNVFPATAVTDPDMHHGTCVTHVPWCMPRSLTSDFLWSRWRGKRSLHSWRVRNPLFCVSG